jgi:glycosyltransferase involved in cell wall biosynthesis
VLFVGRFVPKKGFAEVAAAASDDYDIVFVGGDRPAGVDDPRLHFLGGMPAAEMPAVYGLADVMVVASVGECPLTVLESMSSGLPLVVRDDPALHTTWTSGPGVTFVDPADLGPVLSRLVADPVGLREAGRAAHEFVQARFSWSAHLGTLEGVYLEVLEA